VRRRACPAVHWPRIKRLSVTDVAGHKSLEGAPVRSEQLLQIVIDSIPQRVFWKDRNSVYLGCNRSFAGDAGMDDPALLVGRNDFELAWKATVHLYVADDRLVMESNTAKRPAAVPPRS
jgi:PAS domain-containing protein